MGRAHPLDACGLCLIFFLKKFFSPSSHRVVLVHPALIGALIKLPDCNLYRLTNNLTPDPLPRTRVLRIMDQGSSFLTPEYKSQDGSGTAVYHRFEDRSIILSRNHTYRGLYPQSHLCILGSSLRGVICNYKPTQDDTRKDYR